MRSLLLASAIIVILGVSAPGLIQSYLAVPEAARLDVAGDGARARPGTAEPGEGRQVEIEAARDGHFYVDAEINFRPVRLLVDTGATVIALRRSDAEAAGIRVRPADFNQPVSTANGVSQAAATDLDSVAVRDVEVRGVRALILPDDQLGISLLGGSFLNRLARFQVEKGVLVLEN